MYTSTPISARGNKNAPAYMSGSPVDVYSLANALMAMKFQRNHEEDEQVAIGEDKT